MDLRSLLGTLAEAMPALPAVLVVVIFVIAGRVTKRVLTRGSQVDSGANFRVQLIELMLWLLGVLAFVVVLPLAPALRGQLLSLIGIVLSAAIALASTTFVGNVMAGMMLKAVRNFRTGDYIKVEEYWGRVSERGLLSTEIQTEFRDLVTLPNLFLVTHPVKVIRTSGTLVTTRVSLGYDVPRKRIKELMLKAAQDCGLEDPFVQVMELGDVSVLYRVAGLLKDTKQLILARSRLNAAVLDALHEGGVEIVSPNFMNQRVLSEQKVFIPPQVSEVATTDPEPQDTLPDDLIFDKANEAESIELLAREIEKTDAEIKATRDELKRADSDATRKQLENRIQASELRLEHLRQTQQRLAENAARRDEEG